jgi:hypothetical protein
VEGIFSSALINKINNINMSTRFPQQLDYIFNRPVADPAWYWQARDEEADPFNGEDPLAAFEFIEALCENPGQRLAAYSDDQVGQGLTFIFSGDCSHLAHGFKTAEVSYERRAAALRALFHLFRDVFQPRCKPQLGSNSQEKSAPLSYICYMFWDVSPLSQWLNPDQDDLSAYAMQQFLDSNISDEFDLPEEVQEMMRQHAQQALANRTPKSWEDIQADMMNRYANLPPETEAYYRAIADVMAGCLRLDNPACVESGLHGLGHMVPFLPDLATPLIDDFLNNNAKNLPAALMDYARAARTGIVL